MEYDKKVKIYFNLKKCMTDKLKNFGYTIEIEKEVNQPFGSMYFQFYSKEEYIRFIFDNRENSFFLEKSDDNKSWVELASYSLEQNQSNNDAKIIENILIGKINNYMRVDLI